MHSFNFKSRSVLLLMLVVAALFGMTDVEAKVSAKKKFVNPAAQFNGTWRVIGYDFREFDRIPDDLEKQLNSMDMAFTTFPVNFELTINRVDGFILPGTMNLETMTSPASGDAIQMIIDPSYAIKMCARSSWSALCTPPFLPFAKPTVLPFDKDFLLLNINKWWDNWVAYDGISRSIAPYRKVWHDINPINYSFLSADRYYNFDAWIAKNGDIILPIDINTDSSQSKNPDRRTLGIRLKRI